MQHAQDSVTSCTPRCSLVLRVPKREGLPEGRCHWLPVRGRKVWPVVAANPCSLRIGGRIHHRRAGTVEALPCVCVLLRMVWRVVGATPYSLLMGCMFEALPCVCVRPLPFALNICDGVAVVVRQPPGVPQLSAVKVAACLQLRHFALSPFCDAAVVGRSHHHVTLVGGCGLGRGGCRRVRGNVQMPPTLPNETALAMSVLIRWPAVS
jgi:hypothetical protein